MPELPNIHGWPTREVQALQKSAAEAVGRPVIFRDAFDTRVRVGGPLSRIFNPTFIDYGPEMVIIPAGRFLMGSEKYKEQKEIAHARPFAIGRYAVTYDDYDAFLVAITDPGNDIKDKQECRGKGRSRCPANHVSWNKAVAYCKWLSEKTCHTYRLPSESEWEYACRAGTTTLYSFGETIDSSQANYGRSEKDPVWTEPVGTYPPNPWGLYEMHGNIREWVEDCEMLKSEGEIPADGSALTKTPCYYRRMRGGSWYDSEYGASSEGRHSWEPGNTSFHTGFRVVRTLR